MQSDTLFIAAVFAEDIVAGVILAIAAYWAFVLKGALRNRFSRSQALWLGIVCIFFIPLLPTPTSTNPFIQLVIGIFYVGALPLVLLAWIDGTVRAARRSDPLFRDTLGWSKLRFVAWGATLVVIALYFGLLVSEMVTKAPVGILVGALIVVAYLPAFLEGAPALLLAARRSKSEPRRTNLKWLGLFALFLLLAIITDLSLALGLAGEAFPSGFFYFLAYHGIYAVGYNIFQILFIIADYCLYRNARSLAPFTRISFTKGKIERDEESSQTE
jgi:hypothetical protein